MQKHFSLAKNFIQSLEDPVDKPAVGEEGVIFDRQEFNRIILASVKVSGTHSNDIEGSTIDKQRRVAELVKNERIAETIIIDKTGEEYNRRRCSRST